VVAEEPIRRPRASLIVVEKPEGTKDPEAGTRKDPEAGTRKGQGCSTMKNPPDGYYQDPQNDRRDGKPKGH
jgi:hypothetical protein